MKAKPNHFFLPEPKPQMVSQIAVPASRPREAITLGAAVELWLKEYHVDRAPATLERSRDVMDTFLEFVGQQTVDPALIGRFYAHLQVAGSRGGAAAETTISLHAQKLGTFFKWLEDRGYINESPMRKAPRPPKIPQKEPAIITLEEYQALIKAAQAGKPEYMTWMMRLAWNTGMSLGDCAMLDWSVVDLEAGELHPTRMKTRRFARPCRIPIEPGGELDQHLRLLWEQRSTAWPNDPAKGLYYVHTGCAANYRKWGNKHITRGFRHFADQVRLSPDKTFHSLRASWASRLINSGMNVNQVALTTGHRDPAVLHRYVRADMPLLGEQIQMAFAQERRAGAKRVEPGEL